MSRNIIFVRKTKVILYISITQENMYCKCRLASKHLESWQWLGTNDGLHALSVFTFGIEILGN
jgi:hypothetical protein